MEGGRDTTTTTWTYLGGGAAGYLNLLYSYLANVNYLVGVVVPRPGTKAGFPERHSLSGEEEKTMSVCFFATRP